ncbi:MAG: sigma-70 family RNA polymerase sigma factor [Kiritimatiellae bacterium]|nr:sigma-70 family RNA polymerase sigma factor [Kiritimatiellia bacterium]
MDPDRLDELAGRTQAGDDEAFRALFGLIHREVRLFVSAHAASVDMVDEVVQAAFVTCYQNISKYERRGTFISWVKGIARNLLLKELKQRARYVAVEGGELEGILLERGLRMACESRPEDEDVFRRLRDCLAKLPDRSRELVTKRYVLRFPIRKLAAFFGKSESWAAMTLLRIRESLRVCISTGETGA